MNVASASAWDVCRCGHALALHLQMKDALGREIHKCYALYGSDGPWSRASNQDDEPFCQCSDFTHEQ